jgi:hypothetical protein
VYQKKKGSDGFEKIETKPPMAVVQDMLAAPAFPLPALGRILGAPAFARNGTLRTDPGYDPASTNYLTSSLHPKLVPSDPSVEEVAAAVSLIRDDLLGDFQFQSKADQANAIALFILPYARDLIEGPTPLHLADAPTPGSGKGLLLLVLLFPAFGDDIASITEGRDEDEWRKRITSALRDGRGAIIIDNIVSSLDSGALASALTATTWTDRVLGKSENLSLLVTVIWAATGNNSSLSAEIARRTARIRLNPTIERPWEREGFKHPDLRGWAAEHRTDLVHAGLVLVQNWISRGRPAWSGRPLGSFESWSRVMGGILEAANVQGFLDNSREVYEIASSESEVWGAFVQEWTLRYGEQEVAAANLFEIAQGIDGFPLGRSTTDRGQKTAFGAALASKRDRIFSGYRIESLGVRHRAACYRLQKTGEPNEPRRTSGLVSQSEKEDSINTIIAEGAERFPEVPRFPEGDLFQTEPEKPDPQSPSSTSSDSSPSSTPESEDPEENALRGELRAMLESGRLDELPADTREVLTHYADGTEPGIRDVAPFLATLRRPSN